VLHVFHPVQFERDEEHPPPVSAQIHTLVTVSPQARVYIRARPARCAGPLTGTNCMPTLKATTICLTLLSWSSLCFAADPASADSSDMKARIEQMRKRLESERALPEEQRWALDENHVNNLEERAQDGDTQAAQFLELARDRISRLRRERFI
jgi:hypothetical protein